MEVLHDVSPAGYYRAVVIRSFLTMATGRTMSLLVVFLVTQVAELREETIGGKRPRSQTLTRTHPEL